MGEEVADFRQCLNKAVGKMLWYLLTTGACNLSCRYCGGSFNPRHSPWRPRVGPREVAHFIAQRGPAPVLFFYGASLY